MMAIEINKPKRTIDAYVDFLNQIPWQVYGTFTFPWKEADQRADRMFRDFFRILESHLKRPIGYVRGDEKRLAPSGLGKPPTGRHFHFVLASSAAHLDALAIEYRWKVTVGNGAGIDSFGDLTLGGYAKVRPYDSCQHGLAYCLKGLDDLSFDSWDWQLSDNLYLFLPHSGLKMNSRMRRRLKRMTMPPTVR